MHEQAAPAIDLVELASVTRRFAVIGAELYVLDARNLPLGPSLGQEEAHKQLVFVLLTPAPSRAR